MSLIPICVAEGGPYCKCATCVTYRKLKSDMAAFRVSRHLARERESKPESLNPKMRHVDGGDL